MHKHSPTIFEAQIWYIKNDNPKKFILNLFSKFSILFQNHLQYTVELFTIKTHQHINNFGSQLKWLLLKPDPRPWKTLILIDPEVQIKKKKLDEEKNS